MIRLQIADGHCSPGERRWRGSSSPSATSSTTASGVGGVGRVSSSTAGSIATRLMAITVGRCCKPVCKPDSVPTPWAGDGHPSGMPVARHLMRSDPGPGTSSPWMRRTASVPVRPCSGRGLPGRPVTRPPVGSYPTISPLPRPRSRLCHFCGTLLRVTPTGRYPAPCSVESGLSSGGEPPAAVRPACRPSLRPQCRPREPCPAAVGDRLRAPLDCASHGARGAPKRRHPERGLLHVSGARHTRPARWGRGVCPV